ncbi:MAG TPA: nickel-binding protein [Cyclobacteriaceae bacterium]|nr:nickel-binding protein [Cyclobacteriaceae bacterium]
MDLHKFPHITIDEAKQAHVADERIQKQYGVKYLQFWVNEEAGNLFCLVEGPDKATVETVHQMAHGHVACAVVEVDPSYYSLIMGNNIRIDQGLVQHKSGSVDPGNRFILAVSFYEKSPSGGNVFAKTRESVLNKVSKHDGRQVKLTGDDSLVSVFDSTAQALACAKEIQKEFIADRRKNPVVFRIGLSAGQPVTENNEFIEETIRLAKRLSLLAEDSHIFISSLFEDLSQEYLRKKDSKKLRTLSAAEEAFLRECFGVLDSHLSDENFNITSLVKSVGISRAQLYRKIHSLAGKAPNNLIRDLRLEKARTLLKRKTGNVSEVAFEVGFSNPSYFAKCFAKRFGRLPSQWE